MISLFTAFCLYAMPTQFMACQKSLEATALINNMPKLEQNLKDKLTINISPTLQVIGGTIYTLGIDKRLGLTISPGFANIGIDLTLTGGGIRFEKGF